LGDGTSRFRAEDGDHDNIINYMKFKHKGAIAAGDLHNCATSSAQGQIGLGVALIAVYKRRAVS
jgi:hypothetical protein